MKTPAQLRREAHLVTKTVGIMCSLFRHSYAASHEVADFKQHDHGAEEQIERFPIKYKNCHDYPSRRP